MYRKWEGGLCPPPSPLTLTTCALVGIPKRTQNVRTGAAAVTGEELETPRPRDNPRPKYVTELARATSSPLPTIIDTIGLWTNKLWVPLSHHTGSAAFKKKKKYKIIIVKVKAALIRSKIRNNPTAQNAHARRCKNAVL